MTDHDNILSTFPRSAFKASSQSLWHLSAFLNTSALSLLIPPLWTCTNFVMVSCLNRSLPVTLNYSYDWEPLFRRHQFEVESQRYHHSPSTGHLSPSPPARYKHHQWLDMHLS
uniref:Uncharacterized protein n=1 Tax=Opuntia streptacantha TaxID=393608 RepID=A0A7C9FR49_OPUST